MNILYVSELKKSFLV